MIKLVINDECNCKFIDMPSEARNFLYKKFKIPVPGARFQPSVRLGRWDGCTPLFNMGGSTYINLLPEILEYLDSKHISIDLIDNRDYTQQYTFDLVNEDTYKDKKWPKGHLNAGDPIRLRDYQVEAVNIALQNLQSLQILSTASGKSLITASLAERVEKYGRSILIVPSKSLVIQTEEDYLNLGLDVGVFFGDRKEYTKTHTICTWQSLGSLFKASKKDNPNDFIDITEFLDGVVCVIVDECFAAGTPILTPNGYRSIETLKSGDIIINYSESLKIFKTDVVEKLHTNIPKNSMTKMLKLVFENNIELEVTENHKFLTTDGWIEAKNLTIKHNILSIS